MCMSGIVTAMSDVQDLDPDQMVRYPLTWRRSMAGKVAKAARNASTEARTVTVADWVREAIAEKLERDSKAKP